MYIVLPNLAHSKASVIACLTFASFCMCGGRRDRLVGGAAVKKAQHTELLLAVQMDGALVATALSGVAFDKMDTGL